MAHIRLQWFLEKIKEPLNIYVHLQFMSTQMHTLSLYGGGSKIIYRRSAVTLRVIQVQLEISTFLRIGKDEG